MEECVNFQSARADHRAVASDPEAICNSLIATVGVWWKSVIRASDELHASKGLHEKFKDQYLQDTRQTGAGRTLLYCKQSGRLIKDRN